MPNPTDRSALIVRGGWPGHHPVETTDLFIPFLEHNGFDVRVEESTAVYADAEVMATTDLIVQSVTMSTIEKPQLAGLIAAVTAGTGMAGWHGGIVDSFRNESDYLQFIGAQFASHPRGDARHTILVDGDHPITSGIESFELVTEQYWLLTDDYLDVLATTIQDDTAADAWHRPVVSPAVWTRQWGSGRLFVATPGHSVEVLEHPSVRTMIERGLLWASR